VFLLAVLSYGDIVVEEQLIRLQGWIFWVGIAGGYGSNPSNAR
jgi:hypothetical protein